jgi:hypothetical protein
MTSLTTPPEPVELLPSLVDGAILATLTVGCNKQFGDAPVVQGVRPV